ncbi:MAG: sulfite exporter TauE/SafE family protein [Planctomycetales bacterium]
MWGWILFFGTLVGLSLGLTGGGGAIFAVPLLVYGVGTSVPTAVAISLATVGGTAFAGFLDRWRHRLVELRTGLIFAIAGMVGAPIGTQISRLFSPQTLLTLFGGLMLVVAGRMWQSSFRTSLPAAESYLGNEGCELDKVTCRRTSSGELVMTSRCAVQLLLVGVAAGVLSGLFGVGGGFVIVPALVLFSSMPIQQAIGTSLFVISLISASGLASQWWLGRTFPIETALLFTLGGIAGMFVGSRIARRLPAPTLQRIFAVAMVLVAAYVIVKNLFL